MITKDWVGDDVMIVLDLCIRHDLWLIAPRRFNLLREESEGFAKLVTALCQFGSEQLPAPAVDALVRVLPSTIACCASGRVV
jgi:hypothetical protein